MKRMVISCFPDGTTQHTLKDTFFKPDLGPRQIERMSEILFHEGAQRFYIKFLKGPYLGCVLGIGVFRHMSGRYGDHFLDKMPEGSYELEPETATLIFDTYERAVEVEVLVIDAMRLAGERI